MTERETDADTGAVCGCKIGRNCQRYGVAELHEGLRNRHADGASLRALERFVNETLLESALREASADVIGEVGTIYSALAGEDVSAGERTETRQRLARVGVDVDDLEADFVSYQTVRTHLQECLGVETNRESSLTLPDGRGTVEWARSRSEGIIARTIERLARNEQLAAGSIDVSSVVRVSCSTCGTTRPLERFLEDGGCECAVDDASADGTTSE